MSGNLGGFTDFTGIRIGGGNSVPGLTSSDASAGNGKAWESYKTVTLAALTASANGSTTTTMPFPGAKAGDFARAQVTSSMSSGLGIGAAWVSADNVVTVSISNASTVAQVPALPTLQVVVERYAAS